MLLVKSVATRVGRRGRQQNAQQSKIACQARRCGAYYAPSPNSNSWPVKIFDRDQVADQLGYPQLVESLRQGFQRPFSSPARQVLETEAAEAGADKSKLLLLKSAWDDACTVVKLITINAENPPKRLPYIQGVVVIFDKQTGAPIGVAPADELTCRRTAAASALAADYLARPDASTLTIVGTGALSAGMAHAHAAVRPLRRVNVCGRNKRKAQAVADAINAADPALNARPADLDAAVRQADILTTVTSSRKPVLDGRSIQPGTHMDLVGAFASDAREVDDAAIAKASIYVDAREAALAEAGDLLIPMAAGVIDKAAVRGDLAELCRGQVDGRQDENEITLFKSVGMALEDLVAAEMLIHPVAQET